jgi:hypothetical protein
MGLHQEHILLIHQLQKLLFLQLVVEEEVDILMVLGKADMVEKVCGKQLLPHLIQFHMLLEEVVFLIHQQEHQLVEETQHYHG